MLISLRSPVFNKMFENNCIEAKENCIEITDFDTATITRFIEYTHVGRLDASLDCEANLDVFWIANKYDVQSLKELVIERLLAQMSCANIVTILNCVVEMKNAEMTDVEQLSEACI